jgi:hypothetical protein
MGPHSTQNYPTVDIQLHIQLTRRERGMAQACPATTKSSRAQLFAQQLFFQLLKLNIRNKVRTKLNC